MVKKYQRTRVYIDGFNFYYRALKGGPFKWLNYYVLVNNLTSDTNQIEVMNYYTALVSGVQDPDEPRRQRVYLNALQTIPCMRVHYGNFLSKIIERPLACEMTRFVKVHDYEEKGSDVNLASHLVFDACRDKFDVAVVLTKDTDLIEPIRIAREELGKVVGIICPDENLPVGLEAVASFKRLIRKKHLNNAQFPNRIEYEGKIIRKPTEWF